MKNDVIGQHASEEQLGAILDNLTEFVVRWLPDGIRTYVNPAYCRYYNVSREDATGTSFFPHIAEEDLEKVKQRIDRLSFESPTSTDSHRVIRPDGEICWQEWTDTAIYDDDGRLIEYQSTGRDITERKRMEEELAAHRVDLERLVEKRTSELQIAMDELKTFSYSVSHDLRAPLRRIDGFSSLLLEDHSKQLDDTGKAHLQRIRSNIHYMNELIDDMLVLSQASRHEIRKETIDLSLMAHDIVRHIKRSEPGRKVEFIIQKDVSATGDARLLRIALDNLIGNAWKYTAKVSSAEISFGAAITENGQTYFVRDNGAGFDMENSEQLFRPFQRLHCETEFEGTGIGLATVYRIVQRHGGSIWVDAEANKGATFYFTLGG